MFAICKVLFRLNFLTFVAFVGFVSDAQTVSHTFTYEGQVRGAAEDVGSRAPGPSHLSLVLSVPQGTGAHGKVLPQPSSLGSDRQRLKSADFQPPNLGLWTHLTHEGTSLRMRTLRYCCHATLERPLRV